MDILYPLHGLLLTGFIFFTLLLLIALLVFPRKRSLLYELLDIDHIIRLGVALLGIVLLLTDEIMLYMDDAEYVTYAFVNRATGPYWWSYWTMILFPHLVPQLLWWKKLRRSVWVALVLIVASLIGALMEMFVILVTHFNRDFLPSSWSMQSPAVTEIARALLVYSILVGGIYYWRKRKNVKAA